MFPYVYVLSVILILVSLCDSEDTTDCSFYNIDRQRCGEGTIGVFCHPAQFLKQWDSTNMNSRESEQLFYRHLQQHETCWERGGNLNYRRSFVWCYQWQTSCTISPLGRYNFGKLLSSLCGQHQVEWRFDYWIDLIEEQEL